MKKNPNGTGNSLMKITTRSHGNGKKIRMAARMQSQLFIFQKFDISSSRKIRWPLDRFCVAFSRLFLGVDVIDWCEMGGTLV